VAGSCEHSNEPSGSLTPSHPERTVVRDRTLKEKWRRDVRAKRR
jgi:hypothetical protein